MSQQYKHYKKPKPKPLIFVLLFITVVALGVTVWALFFREEETGVLAPDYAPQEIEENAESMGDEDAEKLEAPSGGGAVTLMYKDAIVVDLSEEKISLLYGNPGESTMNIVLQVVIQDNLIAQSGRLEPGSQVTTLNLKEGAAELLKPGGYDGKFVVSFYDVVSGEKSALNTEIPLTITVIE